VGSPNSSRTTEWRARESDPPDWSQGRERERGMVRVFDRHRAVPLAVTTIAPHQRHDDVEEPDALPGNPVDRARALPRDSRTAAFP
jgi:hypothetical protein